MKKYICVLVFWTMIFAIIPSAHARIYSGSGVVYDSQDIIFGPMKMGYSTNDFNSKGYIYTSSLTYYTGKNVYMGDVISSSACGSRYPGYKGLSDISEFMDVSSHTFSNTIHSVWFGDKGSDCYQGILIFRQNGLYGAIDPVNVENGALHYNWWYDDSGGWDSSQLCKGDINGDGTLNLIDAILALQLMVGINPAQTIYKTADVNGDGKIGMEEVIYILETVAGGR